MAASSELPKTSQPVLASLVNILSLVEGQVILMSLVCFYRVEFLVLSKYPVFER